MEPFFKDSVIEKTFQTSTRTETHQIGVIGGLVGGTAGKPLGRSERWKVTWDDDALVFEHRFYSGSDPAAAAWTERREVWSLDTTGKLHVVVTTEDPVSGRLDSEFVYRRQAS